MRVVGIKALENQLSEYVRMAAAGERVLITDRDGVVAELVPPQEGLPPFAKDALPIAPLQEILDQLDEDRADR
ncbi:MAG TPA: type II toxin-antitoxin system Phd/YefM family antitoxin [Longimicrobiales bacterium]